MKKRYLLLAIIFLGLFLSIIFFDRLNHRFSKLINNNQSLTDKIIEDPDNPFINYKIGMESYKKKKYIKARAFFQKATDFFSIEQKNAKSRSYANSGNCGLRISEILIDKKEKRKEAKEKAIEVLKKTIQDYDASLSISISEKVEKNKLIAEELLKKLQAPQPPQDQSNDDGNDGSNDDNDENKQKSEKNSEQQQKGKSDSEKNNDSLDKKDDGQDTKNNNLQKEQPDSLSDDETNQQEDQSKDQAKDKTEDQRKDHAEDQGKDKVDQPEELSDSEKNMNSEDKNNEPKKNSDSTSFLGIDDNYLEELDEQNSTASLSDKTKDEVAENKQSILKKILSQRSEAEFKTLEEKESSLRRKRIEGITSKNTGAGGKGW